ncbi:MAG: septum formation family protein [Acidimicrobiia bacterium]
MRTRSGGARGRPAVRAALALVGPVALLGACRGGAGEVATTTLPPSSTTTSTTINPALPRTATGANGNPPDERIGPPASNRPSDGTLTEGQCFNEILVAVEPEPPAGASTTSVPEEERPVAHRLVGVDCSQPHDAEVFALIALAGADGDRFPGEAAAQAQARAECLARFEPFVGLEYATSTLRIAVLRPTENTWVDGDRTVVCSVYHEDLRPLVGTARSSGR